MYKRWMYISFLVFYEIYLEEVFKWFLIDNSIFRTLIFLPKTVDNIFWILNEGIDVIDYTRNSHGR